MSRIRAERDAWLSRASPRAKLIALFAMMAAAVLAEPVMVGALLALLLPAAHAGGVRGLPRALLGLVPLTVLNVIVLGALLPADPVATLGPLSWGSEGIRAGVVVTLRLALALSASMAFSAITPPREILSMLGRFPRAGLALSAALRCVPEAARDVADARDARALRVGAPRRGLGALRAAIPALVPAFVRAVRRGHDLEAALRVAGFDGGPRSSYVRARWTPRDPPVLLAACAVVILTLLL